MINDVFFFSDVGQRRKVETKFSFSRSHFSIVFLSLLSHHASRRPLLRPRPRLRGRGLRSGLVPAQARRHGEAQSPERGSPGGCFETVPAMGRASDAGEPPLVSDDDDPPELLIHVPFEGLVKITAFSVVSCSGSVNGSGVGASGELEDETSPPTRVRLFVNRDDLDFDSLASVEPTQEFELAGGGGSAEGSRVEYPCKPSKFGGVYSVDVHFPGNGSSGNSKNTRVDFLGFKGTHTQGKREAVVAVYESRAMPSDHKVAEEGMGGAADVS